MEMKTQTHSIIQHHTALLFTILTFLFLLPGYCMGYPRFGAAVGLVTARQFVGTALSWDAFEVHLFVMMFAAEVLEERHSPAERSLPAVTPDVS